MTLLEVLCLDYIVLRTTSTVSDGHDGPLIALHGPGDGLAWATSVRHSYQQPIADHFTGRALGLGSILQAETMVPSTLRRI